MAAETKMQPGQQAQHLLYYDDLTGLYNRRFYNKAYEEQTKKAAEDKTPMGMILIDVDFFKSINDRYGHQSGDAILSGVGGVINETTGMSGYPIRYAGDEFVVLMPGLSREGSTELAQALGDNVRARTFKLVNTDKTVKMTFSVGVAHYPTDTDDPAKLFEHSDHAAYIAKKNGRDRFVNYEPGVKQVLNASTLYQFFPCSKLIGRAKVMETLMEFLAAPAGQKRPWYILGGDPGVGKTRLLLELRNRVDTQRTVLLETVGLPTRPQQPFGFFIDAVGRYIRENAATGQQMASALTPRELSTVARLLPDLSRYALLASSDQIEVDAVEVEVEVDPVEPFCKMLGLLSKNRSLTIILDDFQQADRESMRLIERLRTAAPQVFLVTAVRDDNETLDKLGVFERFLHDVVDRRLASYIELTPLTAPEVQELIETVLPDAKAFPGLGPLVHEKSGGVALYVEEVLKLLVHMGAMRYEGPNLVVDVAEHEIPADVDALLAARAEQADLDVRMLMARAAVIGAEFDLSTLMMLENRDEGYLHGILERARKTHIISERWSEGDNRISFVSTQTHAAFYRSLELNERQALHQRIGRLRERQYASQLDTALSELAFHFTRSGQTDRGAQYRKMVDQLYSQFVGPTAVEEGVDSTALKQLVGQVELPEPLLKKAVEIANEFKIYLQKRRVYGAELLARQNACEKLAHQFAELFMDVPSVAFSEGDRKLLVNGVSVPTNLQFATGIVDVLLSYDVRGLEFKVGVRPDDIRACFNFLSLPKDELRARGGLATLLREAGIDTIVANEKIFVMVGERDIVLKRTSMREEMLIKELPDEPATEAAPAADTSDISADELEDFREWQRTFRRYSVLDVLQGAVRDWVVLQRDLESGNAVKVSAASKVYIEAALDAVGPLLTVIGSTADGYARATAVTLLAHVTPDARNYLLQQLYAATTAKEAVAYIEALELLADPSSTPYIEGYLQHPDAAVRGAALSFLSGLAAEDLPAMLARALESEDEGVRVDTVIAMGEHQLHAMTDTIVGLLDTTSLFGPPQPPSVQAAACFALGRLAPPRHLPLLLDMLDGSLILRARPTEVRAAAASALPGFATPQNCEGIIAALQACVDDPEPDVADAAIASLSLLTDETAAQHDAWVSPQDEAWAPPH